MTAYADVETATKALQSDAYDYLRKPLYFQELRPPLALIRGYAEVLADGELGELQQEQRKPIETIVRRSRMLSDLVEDITLILGAETRPKGALSPSPCRSAKDRTVDNIKRPRVHARGLLSWLTPSFG